MNQSFFNRKNKWTYFISFDFITDNNERFPGHCVLDRSGPVLSMKDVRNIVEWIEREFGISDVFIMNFIELPNKE